MRNDSDTQLITERAGQATIDGGLAPPRLWRPSNWLRWLGVLSLIGSVALLIVPVGHISRNFAGSTYSDCGVPLQALFGYPTDSCTWDAIGRVFPAIAAFGLGIVLLAFSGIRRRLRFVGLVLLGVTPFLMMLRSRGGSSVVDGFETMCGSAIADLTRRGFSGISRSASSGTYPLDPACGDLALNRFYLSLGIAALGALIIGVAAKLNSGRKSSSRSVEP